MQIERIRQSQSSDVCLLVDVFAVVQVQLQLCSSQQQDSEV